MFRFDLVLVFVLKVRFLRNHPLKAKDTDPHFLQHIAKTVNIHPQILQLHADRLSYCL